jgi:chromosome segregation ATPase
MINETETPRTDAAEPQLQSNKGGWVRADFARELERELNDSNDNLMRTQIEMQLEIDRGEAEVERLTKELAMWDYGTRAKRELERAEKAEAEVEKLRELVNESTREKSSLSTCFESCRRFLRRAETKIKEMRAALGDDGRRTHKEILELATKASEWREWKEKYIALKNAHIAEGQDPSGTIWEHADKLQKELKASQAEVEELQQQKRNCFEIIEEDAKEKSELKDEIERLRSQPPAPVWPEIVRLQGKIAELERQLLSARNDSFNLANALSASEKKLEVAQAEIGHIKTLLKDPSAVHINTLRGTIAALSWDGYEHILGAHPCRERAEKAEKKLEVAQKQLKNYTNAIETL